MGTIVISEDAFLIVIPAVITLLIIWLIIRMKYNIRRAVKNEIYDHFPTIKNKIEEYERKIDFFKLEIENLEKKMQEISKQLR